MNQYHKVLLTAVTILLIVVTVGVNSYDETVVEKTSINEDIEVVIPIPVEEAIEPVKKEIVIEGFKPQTILTVKQESLCTKLAVFGETRNSSLVDAEFIMWVIINRALDTRRDTQYRGTSCGVVTASKGLAFEGMKLQKVVNDIVWGSNLNYVPVSARKSDTPDSIAWKNISQMVDEAYEGKLTRKTLATHFVNLQQLTGPIKDWIKDLKPVGVSSNHFLFMDYQIENGKRVFFTREKPYRVNFNWVKYEESKK